MSAGVVIGSTWLVMPIPTGSTKISRSAMPARYRDYVVDAFNEDKPFDRFVIEQLAGDLLPEADRRTKTATGFLVLGAKVLAEPDRDKLMMDTIDEQLDTIGKAFWA